ncbi:MAG TPA: phosphoribosylanthranilate isomerase [Acidobacteriaceae bacterium]|nr:phosphoribosylanthranilate isomerase [Acidobacteriaceae bacterium]
MLRNSGGNPMWVKICGNTNLSDAAHAAAAGADAVGFIFAESKRRVTAAQVAAITPHLPATVERVGVFGSQDADQIARIAFESGLTAVQLHGGLDEGLLETLAEEVLGKLRIVQTLHWMVDPELPSAGNSSARKLEDELRRITALGIVDRVLIDSKVASASGGTGVAFDWKAARDIFAAAPGGLKLIVAGGLRVANVAAAIAELRPWGVDVSSGVEISPGRKDPRLVESFIQSARK